MAPDLARITFVTRRFGELQGLQSVGLGYRLTRTPDLSRDRHANAI